MRNTKLDLMNQSRPHLLRQPAGAHQEEIEAQAKSAVQRDPTAQLACRIGDGSCAGAHADTVNRSTVQRAPDTLLRLQRQYGNRFVQRVVELARQGEGEADVSADVEQQIESARGGGRPLDSTIRAQMEPAFGANFGGVRVHTNSGADGLNQSLSARAFTTGQDIFFKQGEYNPGTSGGRELLAHELTHVVQQNGAVQKDEQQIQAKLTLGQPGDQYEQEADRIAQAVIQQETKPTQADGDRQVVNREYSEEDEMMMQRQYDEEEEPMQMKIDSIRRQMPENKKDYG
ncbi:MAG: DUF4157 domain-containing protein [Caldilineaceae bacterium]|nr:DUF4157 domain-containing protein [Caldilineaceae bacterium]